jgi:regulator of nucleoside diphosphate kinase
MVYAGHGWKRSCDRRRIPAAAGMRDHAGMPKSFPDTAVTAGDRAALAPRLDDPALREELQRARLLGAGAVPPDLAVMDAHVAYQDVASGVRAEVTIVHPCHADADHGRVSVLSPLGMALLGLRAGQEIDWPFPNGERRRLRLLAVLAQPTVARTTPGRAPAAGGPVRRSAGRARARSPR